MHNPGSAGRGPQPSAECGRHGRAATRVVGVDPLRFLAARQGFFSRSQARELGYDDRAVTRCVRVRAWTRFRRGYYAFTDIWEATDPVGRHRIRSAPVMHSLGGAVALSHVSGVIEHGIATWSLDLSRVHVTRLDQAPGRIEGDVVHHEGRWVANDIVDVDGQRVLAPERCVLEAGSRVDAERSLVMLDSGLQLGRYDDDALCRRFQSMSSWPWMRSMHVPVRMARTGAQSPGESRGRYFCWVWRLPAPLLQFSVRDASGKLLGTTDWAWAEAWRPG